MSASQRKTKAETRQENERKILLSAEKVFASHGFNGATMTRIAHEAGLPKANIHYYYVTKMALYGCVLEDILQDWMRAAKAFETRADPALALSRYIDAKMELSRRRPYGSRVWAKEIISGAPHMENIISSTLKSWVDACEVTIERWIAEGKMRKVNARALLYMIWATTQHYADFNRQIELLNNGRSLSEQEFTDKKHQVTALILASVGLKA